MNVALLVDIGLGLGLLLFLARGVKRGLLRSLAGLLIWIVALVGAFVLSGKLAPIAANALRPALETSIAKQIDKAMSGILSPETPGPLDLPEPADFLLTAQQAEKILEALGMGESTRARLLQQVEEIAKDAGLSAASAVAEGMLQYVTRGILFFALFIGLIVALQFAVKSMGVVLELPVLRQLNAAGGGLLGLAEGALLAFLSFYLLDALGIRFSTETVEACRLLPYFLPDGPMKMISFF